MIRPLTNFEESLVCGGGGCQEKLFVATVFGSIIGSIIIIVGVVILNKGLNKFSINPCNDAECFCLQPSSFALSNCSAAIKDCKCYVDVPPPINN